MGPNEIPSTTTSSRWKQAFAVIVKAWLPPHGTFTMPLGVKVPLAPLDAAIAYVGEAMNVADIVWLVVTFVKV